MDKVTPEILTATTGVKFGCGFVDGKCVAVDKRIERGLKPMQKICCRGCHHNAGYFGVKCEDLPAEYLPYFNYPGGFCGPDGCTLPVEMRSRKCVIYICRDAEASDADRALLKNLEETT